MSGTTRTLWDIKGSDANHIFVVGEWGTLQLWDGTAWASKPTGTTMSLYSVWGSDATHVHVGGQWNTMLFWDGSTAKPQVTNAPSTAD